MNHPNLDICKIIGAEFPDSEFVWGKIDYGLGLLYPYLDERILGKPILRKEAEMGMLAILSPAPTCEELILKLVLLTYSGKFDLADILCQSALNPDKNVAQALAEAVKMILTTANHSV